MPDPKLTLSPEAEAFLTEYGLEDNPCVRGDLTPLLAARAWIPTRARLPEPGVFVLIWVAGRRCRFAAWHGQRWGNVAGIDHAPAEVSHWLPLPAGPEDDDA